MTKQEIHREIHLPQEFVIFDWKEILSNRIERLMAVRLGLEKNYHDGETSKEIHDFLAGELDRALFSSLLDVRITGDSELNTETNINLSLLRTFMGKELGVKSI